MSIESKPTEDKPSEQSVVMLRLEIRHDDKWLHFERPAPMLPKCLSWHKGLWFDYGDEECGPLVVEAVYINTDGSIQVVFEERFHSDATEQSIKDFTDFGWTHVELPST
jgi:hypothetical protein